MTSKIHPRASALASASGMLAADRQRHPACLDFMIKHRIKGIIGGGSATMAEAPLLAYRDAAQRAGIDCNWAKILPLGSPSTG